MKLNRVEHMKTKYFNMICQKAPGGKMVLMAVVDDDLLGENLPNIFEAQAIKLVPTIYTGTYPTIKVISETIKERADLTGLGVNGIITSTNWYNISKEDNDIFGINIK